MRGYVLNIHKVRILLSAIISQKKSANDRK